MVLGGFLYHLLFEAKPRYALPYLPMLLPTAAYGLGVVSDWMLELLKKLRAPAEVKEKLEKEISRFRQISTNSSESAVSRGYIETLLDMPWSKVSKDNKDIRNAEKILDEDHYGLEKVKERMLEFLAVRKLTKKGNSPII